MSKSSTSKSNAVLSFLGSLGAILIFALILFLAYLPTRPVPVDASVKEARQINADEARASGLKKITSYEVINAEQGIARIPIEEAMSLTIQAYDEGGTVE